MPRPEAYIGDVHIVTDEIGVIKKFVGNSTFELRSSAAACITAKQHNPLDIWREWQTTQQRRATESRYFLHSKIFFVLFGIQ